MKYASVKSPQQFTINPNIVIPIIHLEVITKILVIKARC